MGRQTLAVSRSTLASDGNTDPLASLALAAAEVEAAEKERANAECQARAVQHLADLFREQQRELTHQFSRPLAEKITGYITQLFPGAEANTVLGESGFEQIVLTRDGRRFDFGELSGGTQEQVAAAFRLAIAETLAKDHDGCLPVVFDDAFTNTDPERIQVLQRMLDREPPRATDHSPHL
ncbi:MAG: SbcC/MukB-like Walker B domain-containing protein [Verrucomicrobiales bacterium]